MLRLAQIRIMGSPDLVAAVIDRIGAVLDVAYDGNLRANRYGDGVRAYVTAGIPADVNASRESQDD